MTSYNPHHRMDDVVFDIYVVRDCGHVLVGRVALVVAKRIHGDTVESINYQEKTMFLKPSTSFGR